MGPDLEEIQIDKVRVLQKLKGLKPGKSGGPDNIQPRLLKECAEQLAEPLTMLFNKTMQRGVIPDDWKQANVSAIYKKGPKNDPGNYRPVS